MRETATQIPTEKERVHIKRWTGIQRYIQRRKGSQTQTHRKTNEHRHRDKRERNRHKVREISARETQRRDTRRARGRVDRCRQCGREADSELCIFLSEGNLTSRSFQGPEQVVEERELYLIQQIGRGGLRAK